MQHVDASRPFPQRRGRRCPLNGRKGRADDRAILSVGNMSGIPSDLVDSRHLRRSVGQFVTGVTVVTYDLDGSPRGVTVNSFTSVSVDPP